ncbi:beta-galactosidase trimerization domain-containing protein [Victivallis vadensis]|uniref:Beta-galactosidase-like protein n=1 Tax=Victivallis vadensis TaxID=172901 RepID=A0A2U1B881_9BACT|nr:beta-galactosidase trimerization domain-containing protein [Victivallis vadensis]PVY44737.1 beta-galactosidase-like protein [Victivallis vadensis]
MKKFLTSIALAPAFVLGAAEMLFNGFPADNPGAGWGGNPVIENSVLKIRSESANPVFYLAKDNWKNYRVSFTLVRRGGAYFEIYAGWRYPHFIKFSLPPVHQGKILVSRGTAGGKSEKLKECRWPQKFTAGQELKCAVTVLTEKASLHINGELVAETGSDVPFSGGIAFGGTWNSDFEVSDLKVEQLPPPPRKAVPVTDNFERPVIRNGTFFYHGKPTFMLGVNDAGNNFWEFTPDNARPPYEPNDLLTDQLDLRIAGEMGFNVNHTYTFARQVAEEYLPEMGLTHAQADLLLGSPYREHWANRFRHRDRISGMPLVVDYSLLHLFTMNDLPGRLSQAGFPADTRHDGGFMPYVPETRPGKDIYKYYFKGGAEFWLNSGKSNPWVYELFNEVQWYHSKHPENKKLFAGWLKRKYNHDLEQLRAVWGNETPKNFEAAAEPSPWTGGRMKADWMDFLGDRFVEIFQAGKAAIREVDPRPNVYFDIEIAVSSLWYEQNGIDYHKLMKTADIFGSEGGMPFGLFSGTSGNYLEDVYNNKFLSVMFFYDLARAFAGEKPIMNQESYVSRNHGALGRIPVRRSDFTTMLWFEVFHNYSGSQIYCWWKGGRNFPWKTLDDARRSGIGNPPALLNPYYYPLDTLKGIKDFSQEIARLAEIALPYPRTLNDIGILYSLPSVWRQPHAVRGDQKFAYQQQCFNWYNAFLSRQLPVGVTTEQELNERGAGTFKVIAVPNPSHIFPATRETLKKFAAAGGIVLWGENSGKFDQYGRSLPEFSPQDAGFRIVPALKDAESERNAIYRALQDSGYVSPWKIIPADAWQTHELEVRAIRRDDCDLYFLCNWNGRETGAVKFIPPLPGSRRNNSFYVTDMVTREPFAAPSGRLEWKREELRAGIFLALPSQERVLLAVSTTPAAAPGKNARTRADEQKRNSAIQRELAERLAALDAQLKAIEAEKRAAHAQARAGYQVDSAKCRALDMTGAVNMGFQDETAGDRKGGWTDQGELDARDFPTGRITLANVPFKVIDPADNDGKSCAVLAGTIKYFPTETPEIPVNAKIANLYFLHAAAWGNKSGKLFEYLITYDDGTTCAFPINGTAECADWINPQPLNNGYIAWEKKRPAGFTVGAYVTRWNNPNPAKNVKSVKAVSGGREAVPVILGITCELLTELP